MVGPDEHNHAVGHIDALYTAVIRAVLASILCVACVFLAFVIIFVVFVVSLIFFIKITVEVVIVYFATTVAARAVIRFDSPVAVACVTLAKWIVFMWVIASAGTIRARNFN